MRRIQKLEVGADEFSWVVQDHLCKGFTGMVNDMVQGIT
jgi:hypothetical protein